MAIDGYVFVLNKDGQILKYMKGQERIFNQDTIDPPIENATKLALAEDLDYLYILEPQNKRIVVMGKTGAFLMQYAIESDIGDIKDFAVDHQNKKIYFLAGHSIYKTEAIHLNKQE